MKFRNYKGGRLIIHESEDYDSCPKCNGKKLRNFELCWACHNEKEAQRLQRIRDETFSLSLRQIDGWVYLVESANLYKIGRTSHLDSRVKSLKGVTGAKVNFVLAVPYHRDFNLEKHLHVFFRDKRREGEWFALSSDDLKIYAEMFGLTVQEDGKIEQVEGSTFFITLPGSYWDFVYWLGDGDLLTGIRRSIQVSMSAYREANNENEDADHATPTD